MSSDLSFQDKPQEFVFKLKLRLMNLDANYEAKQLSVLQLLGAKNKSDEDYVTKHANTRHKGSSASTKTLRKHNSFENTKGTKDSNLKPQ